MALSPAKFFHLPLLALFGLASALALLVSSPVSLRAQPSIAGSVRSEPALLATLSGVFESWRASMETGDLTQWERTTAYSRQIETRNRIVSQKLPFPQALFDDSVGAPGLAGLVPVGVLSTGETATSTYFGRANFGEDEGAGVAVSDNLLVLHFLFEDGRWLFDNLRVVKLGNDGEILLQIRNGDFSFLKGDEFQPAPSLPPVPQPVPVPDLIAEAWVDATGYEVKVIVNGHPSGVFRNMKSTEMVMGGVRRGQNTVRLEIRPLPDPPGGISKVEVAIYAAAVTDAPANRVFHYKPETPAPLVSEAFAIE